MSEDLTMGFYEPSFHICYYYFSFLYVVLTPLTFLHRFYYYLSLHSVVWSFPRNVFFYSFSAYFKWHAPLLCFANLIYCLGISNRRKTRIMLISCPSSFTWHISLISESVNRSIQTLKILITLSRYIKIWYAFLITLFVFFCKIICKITFTFIAGNKKVDASGHVSDHCRQHTYMFLSLEAGINNDRLCEGSPASSRATTLI